MDEEKAQKEEKTETPTEDNDKGSEPKAASIIDNADKAAERLEAANKKQEELLNRQEEMMAKQRLGGSAEAGGQPPKEEPLSDIKYAEAMERCEVNPLKEDGFI